MALHCSLCIVIGHTFSVCRVPPLLLNPPVEFLLFIVIIVWVFTVLNFFFCYSSSCSAVSDQILTFFNSNSDANGSSTGCNWPGRETIVSPPVSRYLATGSQLCDTQTRHSVLRNVSVSRHSVLRNVSVSISPYLNYSQILGNEFFRGLWCRPGLSFIRFTYSSMASQLRKAAVFLQGHFRTTYSIYLLSQAQ